MTIGENLVRFVLHDSGVDSDKRVIIFATDARLQKSRGIWILKHGWKFCSCTKNFM